MNARVKEYLELRFRECAGMSIAFCGQLLGGQLTQSKGAADFLSKPFQIQGETARIYIIKESLGRQGEEATIGRKLQHGAYKFNRDAFDVSQFLIIRDEFLRALLLQPIPPPQNNACDCREIVTAQVFLDLPSPTEWRGISSSPYGR